MSSFMCTHGAKMQSTSYCRTNSWELQLVPRVHRRGLGRFMMQLAELIARTYKLDKIMLTVFKGASKASISPSSHYWLAANQRAIAFYKRALGYKVDESDPNDEAPTTYEILSKSWPARK